MFNKNVSNFIFLTERLFIKITELEDIPYLVNILRDKKVQKTYFRPLYYMRSDSEIYGYVKNNRNIYNFSVFYRFNNECIGQICYFASSRHNCLEISYYISPSYQGQGFATEAVLFLTKIIFETLNYYELVIDFNIENIPSKRIASKITDHLSLLGYKHSCLPIINDEYQYTNCFIVENNEILYRFLVNNSHLIYIPMSYFNDKCVYNGKFTIKSTGISIRKNNYFY